MRVVVAFSSQVTVFRVQVTAKVYKCRFSKHACSPYFEELYLLSALCHIKQSFFFFAHINKQGNVMWLLSHPRCASIYQPPSHLYIYIYLHILFSVCFKCLLWLSGSWNRCYCYNRTTNNMTNILIIVKKNSSTTVSTVIVARSQATGALIQKLLQTYKSILYRENWSPNSDEYRSKRITTTTSTTRFMQCSIAAMTTLIQL